MNEVTAEIVREFLDYNPETGEFVWKFRDRKYCKDNRSWKIGNTKRTGKNAGSVYPNGYRYITIFHKDYLAHRLAWLYVYSEWPRDQLDHINNRPNDNRIENLREATQSQNMMNRSKLSETSSQYKGVSWHHLRNKWRARLHIDGKEIHLGLFTIEEEAARTYDRAAIEHFGIYANLNFPIEDYLDYIEELAA